MKIGIIGTGISGLGAAYLLNKKHDISVFEANGYVGGHSRTISVLDSSGPVFVDTGFIVFNKKNYPLLTRLFEQIDVPIAESNMSFGVSIKDGWLEYGSEGMFAQKANWLRPQYWRLIADILRFNRTALPFAERNPEMTLGDCLKKMSMGEWFKRYYIQPMGAAIWSCSTETILSFPALSFLRFFDNHGLLTVSSHPQWYTVKGGSREYVKRLTASFEGDIHLKTAAKHVRRAADCVQVDDVAGATHEFDHVVMACHADEALKLLSQPTDKEKDILSVFQYQDNEIAVHKDISFMPKNKKCWASWVYRSDDVEDRNPSVSLSYWMNQLQPLKTNDPLIITLNPKRMPVAPLLYERHVFRHPIFTLATSQAQSRLQEIQNQDRISYCGAYQGYGFHEDGFRSAVMVAKMLGVDFS